MLLFSSYLAGWNHCSACILSQTRVVLAISFYKKILLLVHVHVCLRFGMVLIVSLRIPCHRVFILAINKQCNRIWTRSIVRFVRYHGVKSMGETARIRIGIIGAHCDIIRARARFITVEQTLQQFLAIPAIRHVDSDTPLFECIRISIPIRIPAHQHLIRCIRFARWSSIRGILRGSRDIIHCIPKTILHSRHH